MRKNKLKQILKGSGKSILYSLIVYIIILILHPGLIGLLILMTFFLIVVYTKRILLAWRQANTYIDFIKQLLIIYAIVIVIHYVAVLLGPWGFYGTLLLIVLIAAARIIQRRREFIQGIREIETDIFGAPLEKKYWRGRSLPKIKLVYKRQGGKKMEKKRTRPIPRVLVWISLCLLVGVGGLAIFENVIGAIISLYAGVGVGFFVGYLLGVLLLVFLAWLIPIYIMVVYLRKAYAAK